MPWSPGATGAPAPCHRHLTPGAFPSPQPPLPPLLSTKQTYGSKQAAAIWFQRWRLFYLACSELFAYDGGNEWGVAHMLFRKRE